MEQIKKKEKKTIIVENTYVDIKFLEFIIILEEIYLNLGRSCLCLNWSFLRLSFRRHLFRNHFNLILETKNKEGNQQTLKPNVKNILNDQIVIFKSVICQSFPGADLGATSCGLYTHWRDRNNTIFFLKQI